MAKTRKLMRRMRAIRNIRTVTKAMETVASARFKKVHDRSQAYHPFSVRIAELAGDLISRDGKLTHPLLAESPGARREVLLVLSSSRGLCGAYNAAVLQVALERLAQLREADYEVALHVVGARAVQHFQFSGHAIDHVYEQFEDVTDYDEVAAVANAMMRDFRDGRIGGFEVAYMQFVSAGQQRPAIARLLPLLDLAAPPKEPAEPAEERPEYDYLPSPETILGRLVPVTVRLRLYECFLQAGAAEQLMRMAAMRAATDNADDMTRSLHIRYNRLRQTQITTELTEIIGGRGE
jgi:F-type H+-transporting ATPase subunit gamma